MSKAAAKLLHSNKLELTEEEREALAPAIAEVNAQWAVIPDIDPKWQSLLSLGGVCMMIIGGRVMKGKNPSQPVQLSKQNASAPATMKPAQPHTSSASGNWFPDLNAPGSVN